MQLTYEGVAMAKQFFGEIAAGMLVVASVGVPKLILDQCLSFGNNPAFVTALEISEGLILSLSVCAAMYYIAWRVRRWFEVRE